MNSESSLQLNEFQIHRNQKEYIVENIQSAEYYEMNESAVEAITLFDQGKTLSEAEKILMEKFPHEEIDVHDFAAQLVDLGFVSGGKNEISSAPAQSLYDHIPSEVARFFFNPISYTFYLLLFLLNLTLLLTHPEFIPHYSDFFVSDSIAISMVTYLLLSLILIFIHEMGHILAIRSHDLTTNLSVNHRLFLLVLETDMTHAWRLTKRDRNQLYFSGICFDNVLFFFAVLTQMFSQNSLLHAITSLILLDLFVKFVYQCCVYMKTDFYYALENTTGCYNLMERSRDWLFKQKEEMSSIKEKVTLTLYGLFYIIGVALSILVFTFYMIPQFYYMVRTSLEHLAHPVQTMVFWDGFVFLAQFVVGLGLLLFAWSRTLRRRG